MTFYLQKIDSDYDIVYIGNLLVFSRTRAQDDLVCRHIRRPKLFFLSALLYEVRRVVFTICS